jgi:hypothetical protein
MSYPVNGPHQDTNSLRRQLAVLAAVGVLATATACGGATASPDSAQGTATGASASAGAAGGMSFSQALKIAQCMRAHGAADFPEPQKVVGKSGTYAHFTGTFYYGTPRWDQAENACKPLAPAWFFPAGS